MKNISKHAEGKDLHMKKMVLIHKLCYIKLNDL